MSVNKTIGGLSVLSSANIKGCYSLPVWDSDAQTTKSACISDLVSAGGNIFTAGSGANSSVRCGVNNTALCEFSSAMGGALNCSNASYGAIHSGCSNTTLPYGTFSSISGGLSNCNSQPYGFIGGGCKNSLSNSYSDNFPDIFFQSAGGAIIGGMENINCGLNALIGTGQCNIINKNTNNSATILGGFCNIIGTEAQGSILGGCINTIANNSVGYLLGNNNTISGDGSILGGCRNVISGNSCGAILSGICNVLSGSQSSISSGNCNLTTACMSFIGSGLKNKIDWCTALLPSSKYSAIISGTNNCISSICESNFIGGGNLNAVAKLSKYSSIVNGVSNCISGANSTIINGSVNVATSPFSSIINGVNNCVTGTCVNNSILSGAINTISNYANYSTIVGGCCNTISGTYVGFDFGNSIITGACNTIDGSNNVIINGCCNITTGDFTIIGAGSGNTLDFNGQPCGLILGGSNNSANLAVIKGSNNVGGISIGGDCNTGNMFSIFGSNNSASLGGFAFASSFNCLSCTVGGFICSSPMVVYGKANCLSAGSCADGTSFIVGGKLNVLFDNCSVIINGDNNTIRTISSVTNSGFRNTIINGDSNFICAQNRYTSINNAVSSCIGRISNFARIDGGCANTIYAVSNHANIINGCNNFARGQFTSIVNGASNCIFSFHSSILGGQNNFACCAFSFIAGCGITSTLDCAFHTNRIVVTNMPTSSAGLPSGALWNDLGVVRIVA